MNFAAAHKISEKRHAPTSVNPAAAPKVSEKRHAPLSQGGSAIETQSRSRGRGFLDRILARFDDGNLRSRDPCRVASDFFRTQCRLAVFRDKSRHFYFNATP